MNTNQCNNDKNPKCFMTGKSCAKNDIKEKQKKVFVLMPFNDDYYDWFEFGIKSHFPSDEYDCKYADMSHYRTGEYVICKICEEIRLSEYIIADISEENPNVYYELGMAHALGKKTLILHFQQNCNFEDNKMNKTPIMYGFFQEVTNVRCYSKIGELGNIIGDLGNIKEILEKNSSVSLLKSSKKSEEYKIICLFPYNEESGSKNGDDGIDNHSSKNKTRVKISSQEILEFSIQKSLQNLSILKERKINVDDIKNIVKLLFDSKEKRNEKNVLAKIIPYITNSRYFIIDVTEARPEVFYCLGFIHGLGINQDFDVNEDSTYIYIMKAKEKPEKLPFDIQATRVIHYESLTDLADKISIEIEKIERLRIQDNLLNKAKYEFWRHFNFRNTRFIFASEFVFHPKEPLISLDSNKDQSEPRSRISIQDFKTFNRLAYIMLFLEKQRQLMYDIQFAKLLDFIDRRDKTEYSSTDLYLCRDKTEYSSTDLYLYYLALYHNPEKFCININKPKEPFISSGFVNKLNSNSDIANYIIIGSSCVNVATEIVMKSLYDYQENKKHCGYIFKTIRPYKLRSDFWEKCSNNSKLGIYMKYRDCDKYHLVGEYVTDHNNIVIRDSGLIIFFNNLNTNNLKIENKENQLANINGQFVILCGFSKYGTYGLGRMISYYTISDDQELKEKEKYAREEEKIYLNENPSDFMLVGELISDINKQISKKITKKENYCIEVVIDFKNSDFENNFSRTTKILRAYCIYDRVLHKRDDKLQDL